jgi:hypothetical protein
MAYNGKHPAQRYRPTKMRSVPGSSLLPMDVAEVMDSHGEVPQIIQIMTMTQ